MPYIEEHQRVPLDDLIKELSELIGSPGEFNFAITKLIHLMLSYEEDNYTNIMQMIGGLECAKLELYRRVAAVYEDKKKETNGDIGVFEF